MYKENYYPAEVSELFAEEKNSIERFFLSKGKSVFFELSVHTLFATRKGEIFVTLSNGDKKIIQSGQLFFLPAGFSCTITSEEETSLTCFYIPDCVALCDYFFSSELYTEKKLITSSFNPLSMLPIMYNYTDNLDIVLDELNVSSFFCRLKICELFYVLKHYYTVREVSGMFYPIVKKENGFTKFIYQNYIEAKTVQELANQAHMSLKSFENRFKEVFGTSPGRWMISRKKEKVYTEIMSSSLPLGVISEKCGFSTLSHMSDFCKKHIGLSPSELRKGRKC